jgi:hypothetical protein
MKPTDATTWFPSVRFEVFPVEAEMNAVFWDVTPGSSNKKRRFGETYLHNQGEENQPATITRKYFFAECFSR